jgi:hypothetical protein
MLMDLNMDGWLRGFGFSIAIKSICQQAVLCGIHQKWVYDLEDDEAAVSVASTAFADNAGDHISQAAGQLAEKSNAQDLGGCYRRLETFQSGVDNGKINRRDGT